MVVINFKYQLYDCKAYTSNYKIPVQNAINIHPKQPLTCFPDSKFVSSLAYRLLDGTVRVQSQEILFADVYQVDVCCTYHTLMVFKYNSSDKELISNFSQIHTECFMLSDTTIHSI